MRTFKPKNIVIAAGETESDILAIEDKRVFMGFVFPDGFSGTSLSFKVSIDGVSFNTLHSIYRGSDVSVKVTERIHGKYCPVLTSDFIGIQFVRFVSTSPDLSGESEDRVFKTFQRRRP